MTAIARMRDPELQDPTENADYYVTTFQGQGNGALLDFVALHNPTGSGRRVVVRYVDIRYTATVIGRAFDSRRVAAAPTGGTDLNARRILQFTGQPAPVATVFGAAATDGGAATVITLAAGTPFWRVRMRTVEGVQEAFPDEVFPVLLEGESFAIASTFALAESAAVSIHWREFV